MASSSCLPVVSENFSEVHDARRYLLPFTSSRSDLDATTSEDQAASQHKRRRIASSADISSHDHLKELKNSFPTLQSPDYYMSPSLEELSIHVLEDPDYISQVLDFTIGRCGYGSVKFLGKTDIRWLDLDQIVKFHRNEIIVYEDETTKPVIGQGLNKPAEVTLVLRSITASFLERQYDNVVKKLKYISERQGARFISFDPENCKWKFSVDHFSRFGLTEDEEEDIVMDEANAGQDSAEMNCNEISDNNENNSMDFTESVLCHSLPAHLGLDPLKMKEMRMVIFPEDEQEFEDYSESPKFQKSFTGRELMRSPLKDSSQRTSQKLNSPVVRKTPLALLEYKQGSLDSSPPGSILLFQPKKVTPVKPWKAEGFKLDLTQETPITINHSRNIVDAGLFMGRSFRVGWGPNGILVHTGNLVGSTNSQKVLSSVVNVEKVAIDNVVRDENSKVCKELVEFAFDLPLNLHKEMNHEFEEEVGSSNLKLQKVVFNRLMLSDICRGYIDIVERQLEVPGLPSSTRVVLTHQIMVWELIKVLFSERENTGNLRNLTDDYEEDMMQDMKEASLEVDLEALPLIRRAEFSCWLQESVFPQVQYELGSLNDSSYLEHIFLLMTGRQLDAAVRLASSRGDVRLACLLSQAGGSTVNRTDVALQLAIWNKHGMDFSFIEEERTRLYELLAGNIFNALHHIKLDWKRFLGLLMWYHLPPDATLPVIFHSYKHLLKNRRAPLPVPVYADEPQELALESNSKECLDLSYFLMLLHANEDPEFGFLKTMLSAFSSTDDPLDYHMIWHQRAVLEAIGAISSNDLHSLDMAFVSQLLCLGQCHWAIYVVLHMPFRDDFPHLQAKVIREILFQYCEIWSSQESQLEFIENLGVPRIWLHEAMAVFFSYHGNLPEALEHFIECRNWHRAHTIFMTSVAHRLFLSAEHSDIWKLATSMETHKSEIVNWEFGAGLYISFYSLRSSLQETDEASELDSLESRNAACGEFLGRLNESLAIWGDKLPVEARVVYSKMAEEISKLLLSDIGEGSTRDAQLSCFDTIFTAPLREDLRSSHLQDAVSLFTCYLSEITS
ncbi:nuclear pore complex protein NUP96 [Cucurbita pepo subsp. pepo]|uniref:nuclear pore complex protein NUP96 n=1 Tax=Cucurbita pepo subsp. pepo TaxID=3664 RepID=UPI000C9D28F8|nr:nuclear pore complex protein NUP96 [Cucurbita pepo subsp. pepo]